MQNALEFFISGGPFMYPLLLASIIALTLIVERMISSFFWSKEMRNYTLYIQSGGSKGKKFREMSSNFWQQELNSRKQETELYFQGHCERRLRSYQVINAIGGAAPLLGFIGTVSGMISSFQSIANADKVSVKLVAAGISEALITTGFGLIIAVVCLMTEAIGMYQFNNFTQDLEQKLERRFKEEEHS